MNCPHCNYPRANYRKTVRGLARYLCPRCGTHFTVGNRKFKKTSRKPSKDFY